MPYMSKDHTQPPYTVGVLVQYRNSLYHMIYEVIKKRNHYSSSLVSYMMIAISTNRDSPWEFSIIAIIASNNFGRSINLLFSTARCSRINSYVDRI